MNRFVVASISRCVVLCLFVSLIPACKGEKIERSNTAAAPEGPVFVPAPSGTPKQGSETLEKYSCGTVERLHTWNGIFAGSQPSADDLRHAQANGIRTIVSLRPGSEDRGFDESALVRELGMQYHELPFATAADMSDATLDQARALLRDASKRPLFLHCNSGNRVGAVWLVFARWMAG